MAGEKRERGRKPGDPEDLKTDRLSFRIHPDFHEMLAVLAREHGVTISRFVELSLLRVVDHYHPDTLDAIGRYLPDEEKTAKQQGRERRPVDRLFALRRPPPPY